MNTAYKTILERLTAKVSDLKYIDFDAGQIDDPEGNYPIPFPCCLIRFEDSQPGTVGEGVQEIETMINFRFAMRIIEDMNSLAPASTRSKGLEFMDLLDVAHKYLQGYIGTNFNALDRQGINQEERSDGLVVFNFQYGTLISDTSAMTVYKEKTLTLNQIEVTVEQ